MIKRRRAEGNIDRIESWKSKVKSNSFGIVGPKESVECLNEVRFEDMWLEEVLVKMGLGMP